jgi:HipA-like C-terminal domain
MGEQFPIIEIALEMRRDVEQLGSKPKFWFTYKTQNWLFKEARQNTGEDWSEKLASEIALLLGIQTHQAELAIFNGRRGCAVKSFIESHQTFLVHGNELLGGVFDDYDKNKERGQADHNMDRIVKVIESIFSEKEVLLTTASNMIGYLVFDALVGNTDRHHQNWGVIVEHRLEEGGKPIFIPQLAPSFDHASSLGRELTDEARNRFITEGRVERYISKGRGGIFENADAKHALSPMALFQLLLKRYPKLTVPWKNRVAEVSEVDFRKLVARIPSDRISEQGRAFVLEFLSKSRRMIIETQ